MDGLTEGRIVHYVLDNGEHRPAIVVKVWNKDSGVCNLQVFTDCTNDFAPDKAGANGIKWATSVQYNDFAAADTWHWIEKA